MDKFTKMEFDPVGGLNNSAYQTTPVSEAEARANVQDVSDQLKNRLNGLINELENAETTTSGAERIGSAAIENVTGITVREQILDLKTQIDGVSAGQVTPGSITDEKLAPDVKMGSLLSLTTTSKDCAVNAINELDAEIGDASALTTTATTLAGAINELKSASVEEGNIADGAVTENKIGPGAVTYTKIQNGAVVEDKIASGAVSEAKIASGAVSEAKIASGAITKYKLNSNMKSDNTSLNDSSVCATAKAVYTLNNAKQAKITGGASTITASNLTANRALISDGSGKVAVSGTITSTELGYLNGVTSGIQTQLNGKQATLNSDQKRKISIADYTPSNSVGNDYDIWIKYS